MSVLASLNRAYERLADRGEVSPFGYSSEKIGFLIPLADDGHPGTPIDLRVGSGATRTAPLMSVPQAVKRTSSIAPNFLWDKTSYALGVTGNEGRRTAEEHAAFIARHLEALANTSDPGLSALLTFLKSWTPTQFESLGWSEEIKDQNVVFALETERQNNIRIHDRPTARAIWAQISSEGERSEAICLVTGRHAPIARLHPAIKGVWGAQSSGASIVSFNLDAFTSYGHEQGDNAPVSEVAAFAYTTVLNKFLERGSRHRIQIGDASTVFWADASEARAVEESEALFGALFADKPIDETKEAAKVGAILEKMRSGRPLTEAAPHLAEGVRFFILGLSPNASRLSVRFFMEDNFGAIADRFERHLNVMHIEPPPKDDSPSIWRCLIETAPQRKTENIAPNLAGEWLRAILTGRSYPLTLLSAVLMRLRADKEVNALRVALLKAVLMTRNKEVPVSLDPENKDPGYLLGRLFAAFEYLQTQAFGKSVNATIRDKYYGTASATPRAVFPILQRGATHHLSRLRKDRPGSARWIDDVIAKIFELADADKLFVSTLTAQRQALFAIGYYHQKNDFYRGKVAASADLISEENPT
jgi:CRISPR-associated protein Csd1